MERKLGKDNAILMTELHHLEGFMRPEFIIDQESLSAKSGRTGRSGGQDELGLFWTAKIRGYHQLITSPFVTPTLDHFEHRMQCIPHGYALSDRIRSIPLGFCLFRTGSILSGRMQAIRRRFPGVSQAYIAMQFSHSR
jgi:hypothetical protein